MVWMLLWSLLLVLVAFAWTTQYRQLVRARWRNLPLTSRSYDGPPENAPLVSFLIAGKDEEANIERAVKSVLAQDYPHFELIVINDRSQDRTPQILEKLKGEDKTGRLRVIHVSELRLGWFGKNNAMREGVATARGEWLCFSDADCEQISTNSLSMAMRHALQWKFDFLSLLPTLEMHGAWERIVQPVAGMLMMYWFNPKRVNDPKNPVAYANGPFMLMTRGCYEAIGGHEAVKTRLNEDVHMARLAKEAGQRLFVCRSEDLYRARMYTSLGQIWRGWSRIFYGCFGTFGKLAATLFMLLSCSVLPYASLVAAAIAILVTAQSGVRPGWYLVLGTAGLAVGAQLFMMAMFYRITQSRPWQSFTFVVGSVICIGILINAMFKLKGRASVTWRGTTYRGDKLQSPAKV
jgi:glycosyltransferase involved in cell wall biosynthesis